MTLFRSLAVLVLLGAPVAMAQELPRISFEQPYEVAEGDVGIATTQLRFSLNPVPQAPVSFRVSTEEELPAQAVSGQDFIALSGLQVVVPAGQAEGAVEIEVIGDTEIEQSERFWIKLSEFDGVQIGDGSQSSVAVPVVILDDDDALASPLVGNDDHVSFRINSGPVEIRPGENDVEGGSDGLLDSVMLLREGPVHGQLAQYDNGRGIDPFVYTPAADFAGRDQFSYRLCTADASECVEATVFLRGRLAEPMAAGNGRSDGVEQILRFLPPLADARFLPSSLALGREVELATNIDGTPHLPWDTDQGVAWTLGTLPASPAGQVVEHRVLAKLRTDLVEKLDLRIGFDLDGDGRPSAGEQACLATARIGTKTECEAPVEVGDEPVVYWIAVHSREPVAKNPVLDLFTMRMEDPDSLLKVTGPAKNARGALLRTQASWVDPAGVGPMAAYVRVVDGETLVGEYRLEPRGGPGILLLRVDGSETVVDLPPSSPTLGRHEGFFFDVPPAAASLTLDVEAEHALEVALYWSHEGRVGEPRVHFEMQPPFPDFEDVEAGGKRTFRLDTPREGRWFAVFRNATPQVSRVKLKLDVAADVPALRAGSYFNTEQPGHGLLLYPAGDQWAGLWYTYDGRSQPTWYYLQALRPAGGGIWRAPLYRNAWNGATARSTQVGEVQFTPLGEQRFIMSYMLDGRPGSQIMDALGRGCPSRNGQVVDISSHWFDPARAGNGYSVQTWESGYQFFAAFTYETNGYPLYLGAERADLGGDAADLPLEWLEGACPTCDYQPPTRYAAGVLRRILAGNTLARIELDVDFTSPWPQPTRQTFAVVDNVQLLGGPGSTQGCAP